QGFAHQLRRLLVPEAESWESADDVVLHWGDPARHLSPEALVKANLSGCARAVFGRSWIHYHRPTHHLTLAVDTLGLFPILIAQRAFHTYIATDALALSQLLGEQAHADDDALLELLAYGQLLGERSTLAACQHLHAATVYQIDASGNYQIAHAAPFYLPQENYSEQEALDALVAAVDLEFKRDPDALIPIGGDLESRLLLAAAYANGHRPRLLSYGTKTTPWLPQVNEIADWMGTELYTGYLDEHQFASAQISTAQLGGGEVPLNHHHALISAELVARTRGATLVNSIGAEIFCGMYYERGMPGASLPGLGTLSGFRNNRLRAAQRYAMETFNATLDPFLRAVPALEERFRQRLQLRLEVYQAQALSASQFIDAVYLGERIRRFNVAGQQLLARDYGRAHPFLDEMVLTTLAGLPLSKRLGGRFYRYALQRLNPTLAKMPVSPEHASLWCNLPPSGWSSWHSSPQSNTETPTQNMAYLRLQTALLHTGLSEAESQSGAQNLLRQSGHTQTAHYAGVLDAFVLWHLYLGQQHAACAA
ncbi:hypothetical protein, partial [Candidatus Venteria ishoeyi]